MSTVRQWMSAPPIVAYDTMTLPQARELLAELNIRRLPVVDSTNDLVGIVTEGDIKCISNSSQSDAAAYNGCYLIRELPLREFMRRTVLTITPETRLRGAAELMIANHIHGLPVVVGKRVVGVLTASDLLRSMVSSAEKAISLPTPTPAPTLD